ncbi:MAG: ABC transporter permease [Fuerstiella sp.]
MLKTLLRAHWIRLCRDRVALFLVFVLPVIFFSVFAIIFGGGHQKSSKPADLKVAIWDRDQSAASKKMATAVGEVSGLQLVSIDDPNSADDRVAMAAARAIQKNLVDAALIFPDGFQGSLLNFVGDRPPVEIIYDSANPMAESMLSGVLQGAVMSAMPDTLMVNGLEQFRTFGGPMTQQQELAIEQMQKFITASDSERDDDVGKDSNGESASVARSPNLGMKNGLINVKTTSARQLMAPKKDTGKTGSMIAYYSASVAVMFLMFSMAGSASALLEDQENGTLDRLISGQMSISTLLLGHWLYFVLLGLLQLFIMFVFAALVFKVELSSGPVLLGIAAMSLVTSMASAGFVILLATLCRSRKQLESISTTIILVLSAFGGSMIPRPFLPEFVQETSKLTFNGWALDGYLKVLWYYDPATPILQTLTWHLIVILLMAAGFLGLALWRAKRWSFA